MTIRDAIPADPWVWRALRVGCRARLAGWKDKHIWTFEEGQRPGPPPWAWDLLDEVEKFVKGMDPYDIRRTFRPIGPKALAMLVEVSGG